MSISSSHLDRLKTALLRRGSMATLADWVTQNTLIGGRPYSYKDHEYQHTILSDTSQEVNVRKCSQVGVSESSARLALGMVAVMRPFTVIYTLPTAHFASTFMRTRVDPVVASSKVLKEAIHKTNDNSEVKQFGDSFLYVKGSASGNAPISIPADCIISDETNFSDQEILSQYYSRLTHSSWKLFRRFSTPTIPKFGVDKYFEESRRFFNMCKCNHCGHWFVPDYYKHVRIPGFSKHLTEITKSHLAYLPFREAKLHCPNCDKVPSLQVEHRQYVCENPDSQFVAAGYQVSPFDAPNIITPGDLIKASTEYLRVNDFVNFSLGLPLDDREATFLAEDFQNLWVEAAPASTVNVIGIDVGNTYHLVVGAVDGFGNVVAHYKEKIPMGRFRERYEQLCKIYRPVATVIDSAPHAETVLSMQTVYPTMYASVFVRSKDMVAFRTIDREKDPDEGIEFIRQLNVNRNRALDSYLSFVREGSLKITPCEHKSEIIEQHQSMKRSKVMDDAAGDLVYSWVKTDGKDHWHFAFLYLWLASKIRSATRQELNVGIFSVGSFKAKPGRV